MKTTLSEWTFIDAVRDHDRMSNFDMDGWRALFDYLLKLEQDTGEEIELDIIAFCCDFKRFESVDEYNENYGTNYASMYDIEELASSINDDAFICYAH